MRVRVSIANKIFLLLLADRRALGSLAVSKSRGTLHRAEVTGIQLQGSLDRQGATTSGLHDHGKTRSANQTGAVSQLRRLHLGRAMAPLLLLSGAKDD